MIAPLHQACGPPLLGVASESFTWVCGFTEATSAAPETCRLLLGGFDSSSGALSLSRLLLEVVPFEVLSLCVPLATPRGFCWAACPARWEALAPAQARLQKCMTKSLHCGSNHAALQQSLDDWKDMKSTIVLQQITICKPRQSCFSVQLMLIHAYITATAYRSR